MRVIAGTYRGRPLRSLDGELTRPTTDRVKEALMSAVVSRLGGFEGLVVLDAFAGSGALGIEALSRGAEMVWFCERSNAAFRIIKQNVTTLEIDAERYQLQRGDVFALVQRGAFPAFDLVFLDPPYAMEAQEVIGLVEHLYDQGALTSESLVCYEHAKNDTPAVENACIALQWHTVSAKHYGQTSIHLLRKDAP